MSSVFFVATEHALGNITNIYDTVWPIAVGMWNLRCMVNGTKCEYSNITEAELSGKFCLGSGIHGVNFKRAFFEKTWDAQQSDFAWILLDSACSIFEGWLAELKQTKFIGLQEKEMQFPVKVSQEVARLQQSASPVMKNSFYTTYLGKKDRCYNQIDSLMHCYRVFKEVRNCHMHNGSIADIKLMNAYNDFQPHANIASLCVQEVPEMPTPILQNPISISLRGVVGLSYILIKIMVSIDTELVCTQQAEEEFINKYRQTHKKHRTLKSNTDAARRQVIQYVKQCRLPEPQCVDALILFLLSHHLVSR